MLFLILAILCTTANGLIFRISQTYLQNRFAMLAANYAVCLGFALLFLRPAPLLPQTEGLPFALGIGAFNGLLYLTSFALMQRNTRVHGVVLTTVFSKLGVLVPTALAVAVFHELPTALQILGFVLVIFSILYMNLDKGTQMRTVQPALLLMMLLNGMGDSTIKVFEQLGDPALSEQFLVYTFAAALGLNLLLIFWRREKTGWKDLAFGVLLGIPNYFVARFLLKSVAALPAFIVYPSFNVGGIVLVTLAGVLLFREKLTVRQKMSIGIILVALVLLNL